MKIPQPSDKKNPYVRLIFFPIFSSRKWTFGHLRNWDSLLCHLQNANLKPMLLTGLPFSHFLLLPNFFLPIPHGDQTKIPLGPLAEVKLGGIKSVEAAKRVGEKPVVRGDGGDGGRLCEAYQEFGAVTTVVVEGCGQSVERRRRPWTQCSTARGIQAVLGALPCRLRPRRGARRVNPPTHRLRVPRQHGH